MSESLRHDGTRLDPPLLAGADARAAALAGSEAAAAIAGFDWSATALGPTSDWPRALCATVRLLVASPLPLAVWWGPQLLSLHNDAFAALPGAGHPWGLGHPARETWAPVWDQLGPAAEAVLRHGSSSRQTLHVMDGMALALSPCFDDAGHVAGVLVAADTLLPAGRFEAKASVCPWVQLPLGQGPTGQPAAAARRDDAAGLRHVLLVDDDPAMRDWLHHLVGCDHRVQAVSDGWQALQALTGPLPDLVLADEGLARMDALELVQRLRADPRTATLPVILLASPAGETQRLQALDAGADEVLFKPFQGQELLARIGGVLRLAQVRREAMQREQALRAELERVIESIDEAFLAVDADWRLTFVNAAAEAILGRPRDDLLGRCWWDLFDSQYEPDHAAAFRRAMRDRVAVTVDGAYGPLAGWFEVRACPVATGGLSFSLRDVLQARLAEQGLRDNEQRLREMAEAMPQIVYVTCPDGRMEYINRRWQAYTGRSGMSAADLQAVIHPDDLHVLVSAWRRGAPSGTPLAAEFRMRGADGVYRWFLTRAVAVRDEHGRILRWYGTSTDVDDSRRNAEALAQAHAALQQIERRKDQFIATLAHELRNPLAPLRNGMQLLAMGATGDSGARVQAMMRRQIDQLVRLVDDLLEVSRITSGKVVLQRSALDLAEVLQAAAETARPLLEQSGHTLVMDTGALAGRRIDGDAMRLSQVFANLLNNAAKYTEAGGRITLAARLEQPALALVQVQDNGVGLAPGMLEEVFQPFVQADRSAARAQGGLGIGLSLVRSLVELHGGSVRASSPGPGRGSTFEVRLPLLPASLSPGDALPPAPDPLPRCAGGPSVLVVDDNRDAADSLGYMLEMMGARVRVVYGGPDAVAAVEAEPPALVLLDLGMPGMDGFQVVRRLARHRERERMQVVALTGWGQTEDRQRTREAGFDEHLVKPAAVERLEALLAQAAQEA